MECRALFYPLPVQSIATPAIVRTPGIGEATVIVVVLDGLRSTLMRRFALRR